MTGFWNCPEMIDTSRRMLHPGSKALLWNPLDCRLRWPNRRACLFRLHCEVRQSLENSAFSGRVWVRVTSGSLLMSVSLLLHLFLCLLTSFSSAIEPPPADPQGVDSALHTNIGVKECAACHSAPSPIYKALGVTRFIRLIEAREWLEHDKHAYAYELVRQDLPIKELEKAERKSNKLSIEISSRLNWNADDRNFEKKCLTCHIGSCNTENSSKMDVRFGVQCESCHGPGSEYTKLEHHQQVSWRAKAPDQKSMLGMWDLSSPSTTATVCLSCHLGNVEQGRFITHDMYAAGHPVLPPFDLQTFLNAMPPHWKTLQEKSGIGRTVANTNATSFELQSEYNRVHFDIAGTTDEIQSAIQGSYDKTRRSMIGGLVANDLGIELIHQAAFEPKTWGDYSIYNCMGCHQELKKNGSPIRLASRIPGRPFPSNWLTLEYPAINASDRRQHEEIAGEMLASFNSVPFGDANRLNQLSEKHLRSLVDRNRDRRKMEMQVMSKQNVQRWLEFLVTSRQDSLADYWVAKQTAWMVGVAVDELVEHGDLAPGTLATQQKELREILHLELQLPQKQSVLSVQKGVLETARTFDFVRCKELLNKTVKAVAAISNN